MGWRAICAGVLVLGAVGAAMQSQFPRATNAGPRYAPAVVEAAVKARLRDPDSAQFGKMYPVVGGVCGSVNSKNGFGGFSGETTFVYVSAGNQVFIDPRTNNASFVKLWHQVCDS